MPHEKKLFEVRTDKKLTQQQAAEMLGISGTELEYELEYSDNIL